MSRIVVAGPDGAGTSLVAAALAARLRARFVDGHDLHPRAHGAKMSGGASLDEDDRRRWLDAVSLVLERQAPVVVSAPPLRREYRDRLRAVAEDVWFAELVMPPASSRRKASRRDRVLPAELFDPQDSAQSPLTVDEAGARFAHDADLEWVVGRIAAVRDAQSLR
jgi:carbohydrate kinase (thermoresistant glucokinase family)